MRAGIELAAQGFGHAVGVGSAPQERAAVQAWVQAAKAGRHREHERAWVQEGITYGRAPRNPPQCGGVAVSWSSEEPPPHLTAPQETPGRIAAALRTPSIDLYTYHAMGGCSGTQLCA